MLDKTILVVDDEENIRTLLRNVLEDEGFSVVEATTLEDVLTAIAEVRLDLVTLDIQLGVVSGLEVARQIRRKSMVPIIMVTGKVDVIDRVVGLEVGADDYITKPFHVREVVARVRSVLRRAQRTGDTGGSIVPTVTAPQPVAQSARYLFDGLVATPDELGLLDRSGADCGMTSGDFRLLTVFLERPKRVLSREQLMDLTGGLEWSPLDRTIDNQIARLRKKIERDPSDPKLIKTVRGVGYTLACDVQSVASSRIPPNSA
jgi:DNA-binding response OmpR family regulator